MKNLKISCLSLFLVSFLFSCSYTPPEPADDPTNPRTAPVAGTADFSKYVAVGNSITAGFMDNALYEEGQQNAYPVILAERMKLVNGGAAFNMPVFASPTGAGFSGFVPGTTTPVGRFRFVLPTCASNPLATNTLGLTPAPIVPGDNLAPYDADRAALNNFSAPGTRSFHVLVNGYGASPQQGNPFYWRFASAPAASVLGDALAAQPTFFSYWLGLSDVLFYAISGGSGNANPGTNPATYTANDMTDPAVFEAALSASLNALLSGVNTKGVVATVPDLTKAPFFRVINDALTTGGANSPLPFALSEEQAAALNAGYAQLGPAAAAVNFRAGKVNYPVITTATGLRHMDPGRDFLVLTTPQDSLLAGSISACNPGQRAGWGITKPIDSRYVLDETEGNMVKARIEAFNTAIRAAANAGNYAGRLAVADIYQLYEGLDNSRNSIAPGGYISVDGIHPNPMGQALIANEFIEAINAEFGSTLPPVNIRNYRQNILPES
ncbi:hypothetical protein DXT99_07535 [Pontibacter diazotrophicus]|uniref:G-D-S-L family lipolytic protein n=1 Tax=Pontibacter diazotrophicus TaxID=1400979 RepID=A0A3D8LG00_9BACT|nr:SGNH/GDSL hydrolase family protein [Pontibacter diazotrophicus]RDV15842.1 hypothetical protein DXT99_07535 [Pontibacter diazotrophicus]